jgi:hypothetical protein
MWTHLLAYGSILCIQLSDRERRLTKDVDVRDCESRLSPWTLDTLLNRLRRAQKRASTPLERWAL